MKVLVTFSKNFEEHGEYLNKYGKKHAEIYVLVFALMKIATAIKWHLKVGVYSRFFEI